MEGLEISLMWIISYSGEARSLCSEALQSYRDGNEEAGRKQCKGAEGNLYTAKRAHSRTLKQSTNGGFDQISLLMVHAENRIMASEIIYQMTGGLFHCMSETKGRHFMLKIILVCSNGTSTAIMAKRMNEESDGYCYVETYSDDDFMNYLEGCDLILAGSQICHKIPRIEKFVDASVPVVGINPSHRGLMNAKGVVDDVKKIMKGRK